MQSKTAALMAAALALKEASSAGCTLNAPGGDAAVVWVETGNVMKMWTSDGEYARNIVADSQTVPVGAMYAPLCLTAGYTLNQNCVVECTADGLDFDTYCNWVEYDEVHDTISADVCKWYDETDLVKGCSIDWSSADLMANGLSYKANWDKVLEEWEGGKATAPGYVNEKGIGMPIVAEEFLTTLGFGWAISNVVDWTRVYGGTNPDGTEQDPLPGYSWDLVAAAYYIPHGEAYPGPVLDPHGSPESYEGYRFQPLENITGPMEIFPGLTLNVLNEFPPASWDYKVSMVLTYNMVFDPCTFEDDTWDQFFGLPKECFLMHQIGAHVGTGMMWAYYPPLKDGTLDFFGVCNSTDVSNEDILTHFAMNVNSEGSETLHEIVDNFGGNVRPHGRSTTLHWCIDPTDKYGAYPCAYNSNSWSFRPLNEFTMVDPNYFVDVHNTPWDQCAKKRAGLCDDIQIDEPVVWTEYAAASAGCADSSTWYKTGEPAKDCSWAAEQPETRCNVKDDSAIYAFERCYAACGICGEKACVDDPAWFKKGSAASEEKNCDWVGRAGSRFTHKGDDGSVAWQSCGKATAGCDFFGTAAGGETCGDSSTWHKNGDSTKNCDWVAEKPDTRCAVKGDIGSTFGFEECSSACGSCGTTCVDSATWHKKGESDKGCDWVSRYANRRIVVGEDGTMAWESCRMASRSCEM